MTNLILESVWKRFGSFEALKNVNLDLPSGKMITFLGPSGSGKSTLFRLVAGLDSASEGVVCFDDTDVTHMPAHKRNVGMVFQRPNPFPMSIYENVCYGLKLQGVKVRRHLDDAVESALKKAALWNEVKDRLFESAQVLSGGQQQRLVIARALALKPDILLLDEPTSALDPLTTLFIEELMDELKKQCTIIIVTHNMQQAARVSDYTAFFHQGRLIEYADSDTLFTMPDKKQTEDYITGRYG